eukprot:TRINITY_DN42892_c0_g1_i1.p2 TRINITY_DN42892_c0_g1~~TRINITY_DN42892_c0_g1_i1.p2  ORF type:complete len:170 (+),score=70.04 TRINITY_DN42892_c0_g1_i1:59-568(+)
MMMRASLLLLGAAAVLGSDYSCPGSPVGIHASCEVTATVNGSCADAFTEAKLRILLNANGSWVDPHNGGTYSIMSESTDVLNGKRLTGNKKYTDHFTMKFESTGSSSSCNIVSCSESQSFSYLDYSTNYCNVHDLYCGTANKCTYVRYNFVYTESFGSCKQHDTADCTP